METEAALKKQGHKMTNIILPFCSICTPDNNWFKKKLWRRGSESNRRPRLCRPLHNHSATPPLTYEPNEKRESLLASPNELERETRFELATPTLARLCSTTELFPRCQSGHYIRRKQPVKRLSGRLAAN